MTAVEQFTYGNLPVRTVMVDGEPWFVARDVTVALGYADSNNAVKQHCKGVAKHHPLATAGGAQSTRIIAEPDVLRLIIGSRLPAADEFERWVFEDVLPTIRRTGRYGSDADMLAQLPPARLLRLAAEAAERAEELQAKVAADAPKVLFADSVATSETTILVSELAKILRGNGVDIGGTRLFARLREDGYLISRASSDYNTPTQRAMDLGLFRIKETAITHADGRVTVSKTPKVTGKGQQYFINRYAPKEVAAP